MGARRRTLTILCVLALATLGYASAQTTAKAIPLLRHAKIVVGSPYPGNTLGETTVDEWLSFSLRSLGAGKGNWLVQLTNAERAELFVGTQRSTAVGVTGENLPFNEQSLPFPNPSLVIPPDTGPDEPLLVHVLYHGDRPFAPLLQDRNDYADKLVADRLVKGLFLGAMLAVMLFNLYAFFGLREEPSIFFAVYVLALIVNELGTTGLGAQYFWPYDAVDARLIGLLTNSLGFASFVIFARAFLTTRRTTPTLDTILIATTVLQLVVAVAQYVLPIGRALVLPLFGIEIFGSLLVAFIGIARWRQGYLPARFFVIAFVPSMIGVFANLYYDAFLPAGNWFVAANGVEFGTALESIIISFSVIDRMRALDREKRAAQRVASTDALTGIANRLAFYDAVQNAINAATLESRLGILYVDLDGFKPINDQYGHRVGDELLRIVARRLHASVRANDSVARVGGDEFTVFLRNVPSPSQVARIAEHVRKAITESVVFEGKHLRVGASIGLAIYPTDGTTVDALMETADRNMYREKQRRG